MPWKAQTAKTHWRWNNLKSSTTSKDTAVVFKTLPQKGNLASLVDFTKHLKIPKSHKNSTTDQHAS